VYIKWEANKRSVIMEITEALEKKKKAEEDVCKILSDLSRDTGLEFVSVDVDAIENFRADGKKFSCISTVPIKLIV